MGSLVECAPCSHCEALYISDTVGVVQTLPHFLLPIIFQQVIAFEHRFEHVVVLGVALLKQIFLHDGQFLFVNSEEAALSF